MDSKKKIKMALISGASHALKYKKANPYASDEEVLQHVNRESEDIINKLGSSI